MKRLWLICLVLLLSACGTPGSSTPAPTPQAINLIFPVALQPWADKLGTCAAGHPLIALYFMPSSTSQSSVLANEIVLTLGDPSQPGSSLYLSQVGEEQVVLIVNQGNELSQLSIDELRSIYTGQTQKWGKGTGKLIQVWVSPIGDPTRTIFDQAVLPERTLTSEAMLAPDPTAMLEAISGNINAIGYIPRSTITAAGPAQITKVKIIPLVNTPEDLNQPVIAMTLSEPQGLMRDLVVCLQTAIP